MRIKLQTPRGLVQRKHPSRSYHWWMQDEQPRKVSRLAQLSKRNARVRISRKGPSEAAVTLRDS